MDSSKVTGWLDRGIRLREIVLIAAVMYAVWTPTYFLMETHHIAAPDGERVALILPTGNSDEHGHPVRFYGFKQSDIGEEAASLVVYEGATPLPADRYAFAPFNPKNTWRAVDFKASDGSDPKHNGRTYYAVLPRNSNRETGSAQTLVKNIDELRTTAR
ncbi:hypothetical protein ACVIW2_008495 [Bradyrhizobium huanghuaihaiense]|uniref:Uncharacterized protein n=1 Tax=Bradyrhizobium huanghuaihaiense TaxID=990078 RepID=A0A562QXD4_9BRAD|nr:hypothetical protein [Bradyrhizobium huanghuaihaiense]TWI61253.1 hypothetical protein IQ16_07131 [Bradyrhizobium huanghuaihaiense]